MKKTPTDGSFTLSLGDTYFLQIYKTILIFQHKIPCYVKQKVIATCFLSLF